MKATTPTCHLTPINLHDPAEHAEMQRQRRICGWDHEAETIEGWKLKQDEGLKSFFWICIPDPTTTSTTIQAAVTIRAGHIALDAYSDPPDEGLARADRSILTIQTFFILPEYRAMGLGRRAMDLVEERAATVEQPHCRSLALTTKSERHYLDESPEGTGVWARTGSQPPLQGCSQWWYARRGYVTWKEEARWSEVGVDGSEVVFYAAFMRKEVKPQGVKPEGV
ncbi:GNAT family N-acetyltransferase [Aspergillus saccharolyticus JOP 1030-1]|uniref:N-acetyltransferase domain-containing protein n=1 Tax=Aspergillus saccharolyticus JOP 1030-1 TaxID=1450539 RepID=A0A318ZED2_9EURO|nr:hypothetical protein BP01DRAFT_359015 [Aspergillus saccharolyticus JOP 1030-1]PYH43053.1 hypothetical protein BP01DRAFT_359015 [Aspergillus saccharolyticus JOP 1030-1]